MIGSRRTKRRQRTIRFLREGMITFREFITSSKTARENVNTAEADFVGVETSARIPRNQAHMTCTGV